MLRFNVELRFYNALNNSSEGIGELFQNMFTDSEMATSNCANCFIWDKNNLYSWLCRLELYLTLLLKCHHLFRNWMMFVCFSVDGSKEDGSLGRLVNDDHSNPNSRMRLVEVDGRSHICLFATRPISIGEEISYNYGGKDWPWRKVCISLCMLIYHVCATFSQMCKVKWFVQSP